MSIFRKRFCAVASGVIGFISYPVVFAYHSTDFLRNEVIDDQNPWWLKILFGGAAVIVGTVVSAMAVVGVGWFMMPATAYYAGSHGYQDGFVKGCEAPFTRGFDRFFGAILQGIWNFFSNAIKSFKNNCCSQKQLIISPQIVAQSPGTDSSLALVKYSSNPDASQFNKQPAQLPPGQSLLYPPKKVDQQDPIIHVLQPTQQIKY